MFIHTYIYVYTTFSGHPDLSTTLGRPDPWSCVMQWKSCINHHLCSLVTWSSLQLDSQKLLYIYCIILGLSIYIPISLDCDCEERSTGPQSLRKSINICTVWICPMSHPRFLFDFHDAVHRFQFPVNIIYVGVSKTEVRLSNSFKLGNVALSMKLYRYTHNIYIYIHIIYLYIYIHIPWLSKHLWNKGG